MKLEEFTELVDYVHGKHRFGRGGRGIKYIEPVYDTRYGDIFCIIFRGWDDKIFSLTNENKNRDLKEWVYEWLKESEYNQK